ncbi:MAG: FAD-dependent oxidoreductase [Kiritimatiellae bacterium]|jgi:hypothetical protein|nr:FAD-dependent oxidoreductase [Kiritimatiellia bacterium]
MSSTRRQFFLTASGGGIGALASLTPVASQAAMDVKGSKEIIVPEKRLPILAEADVVVCGGGTAGIAAACSAARHGAKVILLERWPSLGGMATNALVNIWHTGDRRKQVIFGLLQEAAERGGRFVRRMSDFPKRPEMYEFDPVGMRVVFDQMLKESGVRVLCNLTAVESVVTGDRMHAVLVDTKTGRKAVKGRIFIDATGDGDVAANAGIPFDFGRASDGAVQGMTMMFQVRGLEPDQVRAHPEEAERVLALMKKLREDGKYPQFMDLAARSYLRSPRSPIVAYNMCPVAGNPLEEEELSRLSAQGREQVYQYVNLWRKEMPGFKNAEVCQMGFGLGIRESRRIRGIKTLDGPMVVGAIKQPDALGHGFWMIDIHDPKGSGHTSWADQRADMMPPAGESYHIPLGMCLNKQINNLAVVGRCSSSTHEACASVRIQSHCMVMGQGVGTCAALAIDGGKHMAGVDIRNLQSILRKDGAYIKSVPAGT